MMLSEQELEFPKLFPSLLKTIRPLLAVSHANKEEDVWRGYANPPSATPASSTLPPLDSRAGKPLSAASSSVARLLKADDEGGGCHALGGGADDVDLEELAEEALLSCNLASASCCLLRQPPASAHAAQSHAATVPNNALLSAEGREDMTEACLRVDIKSPRQIAMNSPRHRKAWQKTKTTWLEVPEENERKGDSSEFPTGESSEFSKGEPSHPLPVSAFPSHAGDVHVANAADAADAPISNSDCRKERRQKKSAVLAGDDGVEWHASSVILGLGLGFTLALVVTSRNSLNHYVSR